MFRAFFQSKNVLNSMNSLCHKNVFSINQIQNVSKAAISVQNSGLSIINRNKNNFRHLSADAKKTITIYFIDRDGEKIAAKARLGANLLDVALDNSIDLEGFGACEGTLSCSTCHLIFKEEDYKKLKEPSDEENDMLDLAFGLTDTSRLGCQVIVKDFMDGWTLVVPKEVSDARA